MARYFTTLGIGVGILTAVACGTAHADRIAASHRRPVEITPSPSPYAVELVSPDGHVLETYRKGRRFYVLGQHGERYSLRVVNPTDRRIEAVISVDGLDVIDGESADYISKRGYVIPAHGQVTVDGFRVSTSQVAAFRFSSVSNSYAGRKGKARNVGVIGVAIFAEKEQPQIILRDDRNRYHRDEPYPRHDYDLGGGMENEASAEPPSEPAPPPRPRATAKAQAADGAAASESVTRGAARKRPARHCCGEPPRSRPGLGTEFGERRYSAVSFTRFERANPSRPTAIAELRYNDAEGLQALGIRVTQPVDEDELLTRETADPFPASRFAQPPR